MADSKKNSFDMVVETDNGPEELYHGFRSESNFLNHPDRVCYVPENWDFDEGPGCTGNDFLELCDGDFDKAHRLFSQVDWEHPSTLLEEWEMYEDEDREYMEEDMDRFLRINDQTFSFEEVANALGIQFDPKTPIQVHLCQRVDSGILVAKGAFFDNDPYPSIDVDLHLPEAMGSMPVMISRTEQPRPDGESHALRTFGYNRDNDYFMYFDPDIRPDDQVEECYHAPSITISGDPAGTVQVYSENHYVMYRGEPSADKSSLNDRIQSASARAGMETSQKPSQNKDFEL